MHVSYLLRKAMYCVLEYSRTRHIKNRGRSYLVLTILVDPLEGVLHVPEPCVARTTLMQQCRTIGETSDSQPIVIGDEDEITTQVELKVAISVFHRLRLDANSPGPQAYFLTCCRL